MDSSQLQNWGESDRDNKNGQMCGEREILLLGIHPPPQSLKDFACEMHRTEVEFAVIDLGLNVPLKLNSECHKNTLTCAAFCFLFELQFRLNQ